ncbi:hypothetical protein J3F83DRAFT_751132 [Trichoderma novae-zelandiae]
MNSVLYLFLLGCMGGGKAVITQTLSRKEILHVPHTELQANHTLACIYPLRKKGGETYRPCAKGHGNMERNGL